MSSVLRGSASLGFFQGYPCGAISPAADVILNGWLQRVNGVSSNVTTIGTRQAVGCFIQGLIDDGVWDKIARMNIYVGDDINALKAPLKNAGSANAQDVLVNIDAADYAQNVGVTCNGTDEYIETGILFNDSPMGNDDIHIATYTRAAPVGPDLGVTSWAEVSGPLYYGLMPCFSTATTEWHTGGSFIQGVSVADTAGIGFYIGTRNAGSVSTVYKNGTSVGSNPADVGSRLAQKLIIHGGSSTGSVIYFTAIPIEMYSIGTGLTSANAASFNTHYQLLRRRLGRG